MFARTTNINIDSNNNNSNGQCSSVYEHLQWASKTKEKRRRRSQYDPNSQCHPTVIENHFFFFGFSSSTLCIMPYMHPFYTRFHFLFSIFTIIDEFRIYLLWLLSCVPACVLDGVHWKCACVHAQYTQYTQLRVIYS